MGFNPWKESNWKAYSQTKVQGKSTAQIYTSNTTVSEFDPKNIKFRESRDSATHPKTRPVIVGLDVTGSMAALLKVIAEKLGDLVSKILERKPITDPHIMFMAIGDSIGRGGNQHDKSPLQVTQFEADIKIAEQLTKLWFEEGGWGNGFESYPLAWYYAARHTKIDSFEKRGEKGFLFTIGDDGFPDKLTKEEILRVFGDTVESDIPIAELLAEVNRKYEVFHLCMVQGGSHSTSDDNAWKELLGDRARIVKDYTMIPEIIVSILETMGGKTIEEVVDSWNGSTAIAVREALTGLTEITKSNGLIEF